MAEYIARDSVEMASLFVSRLFDATDRLQGFSFSGRIIPEINNPDCREVIYGTCRIMYRIEGMKSGFTGVIHGARDWKPE
ncbi:MAG: type II toxin-antitoxin system RelE/ParE family toxin [Deltaproteobacteria bacterium]|nr:type II toxin-antitoxin system RelE/ParE family toxin [Deltaproteobacteria bacterium]